MSARDQGIYNSKLQNSVTLSLPAMLVDANALLQKAIQNLSPAARNAVILRCDEMACLQGDEVAIGKAFTQLLQLIVNERESGQQLYLHITCSLDDKNATEEKTLALQRFSIQFNTNITPQSAWMRDAEPRLNSIASLLLPNGSLQVNQLKNSGCVFCISLPGK
jgi:hypothetical protein